MMLSNTLKNMGLNSKAPMLMKVKMNHALTANLKKYSPIKVSKTLNKILLLNSWLPSSNNLFQLLLKLILSFSSCILEESSHTVDAELILTTESWLLDMEQRVVKIIIWLRTLGVHRGVQVVILKLRTMVTDQVSVVSK